MFFFFGEGGVLPRHPGWGSATFLATTFFDVGSPPAGNGNLVGFWPILGLWHLEKFRAQAENTKTQFPGVRRTFMGGEMVPRHPGWFSTTFSRKSVFFGGTPTGQEWQFSGGLAHFGSFPSARGSKRPKKTLSRYFRLVGSDRER